MTREQRMAGSVTHVCKAIFPNTTNHYDTLFGGQALGWMDEVAFITATRFCRRDVVTVSMDRTDFTKPIPAGTIVEMIGRVVGVGRTSIKVEVELYMEEMFSDGRESAIKGTFTMVAIDEQRRPISISG
ncbi:MAG: acyl-CoA thioesterase [candidate division Zixibacteria bacterium]|nr:acyl-CoA thioesterase [candidate division Zixibacteria bacterium]